MPGLENTKISEIYDPHPQGIFFSGFVLTYIDCTHKD